VANNRSPFQDLPKDIIKDEIGKYLSDIEKKHLAEMGHKWLFFSLKDSIKPANLLIQSFLLHVIRGEFKEAEEMIKKHPELLKEKRTVRDEANPGEIGRSIHGTALQIAWGAKDVSIGEHEEMAEMLKRHLIKHYGEEEFVKQYTEQFPEGWEEKEEERKKNDSVALKKVFAAIEQSTTDKDCEGAIEEFKSYLKKQTEGVITTGYHFNDQLFVEALELYDSHYNQFGGFDSIRNRLAAIKVLGCIERYFPSCLAQAACDGFGRMVEEKKALSRTKSLADGSPFYHPNLGVSHFVYSYYGAGARRPARAVVGGYLRPLPRAFQNLCRAKTSNLQNYAATRQLPEESVRRNVAF
jgi:hypothetical protein